MAIRQPLVVGSDGLYQQLQSGDSIAVPTTAPSLRVVTNAESATALVFGMPAYANAADTVKRAQANAKATSNLAGLCYDTSIAASATGTIAAAGVMVGTTAQWDIVAGTTGGLVFNTNYFLDATTAGKLTATPPTTVGQCLVLVGMAISTTELEVRIQPPVLL